MADDGVKCERWTGATSVHLAWNFHEAVERGLYVEDGESQRRCGADGDGHQCCPNTTRQLHWDVERSIPSALQKGPSTSSSSKSRVLWTATWTPPHRRVLMQTTASRGSLTKRGSWWSKNSGRGLSRDPEQVV